MCLFFFLFVSLCSYCAFVLYRTVKCRIITMPLCGDFNACESLNSLFTYQHFDFGLVIPVELVDFFTFFWISPYV